MLACSLMEKLPVRRKPSTFLMLETLCHERSICQFGFHIRLIGNNRQTRNYIPVLNYEMISESTIYAKARQVVYVCVWASRRVPASVTKKLEVRFFR